MNRFIEALPIDARHILDKHLREVDLIKGQVLHRIDEPVDNIYFPHSGLISLMVIMESGETADVSLIGRSGFVCSGVALDAQDAIDQATVEVPGRASAIGTRSFIDAYRSNESLQTMVNRHQALHLAEGRQLTACNAIHSAEKRLCRWLAQAYDQTGMDEIQITQEALGRMVSVRRTTINKVYNDLEDDGLISVNRGGVRIANSAELQRRSCECYSILKSRAAMIFRDTGSRSQRTA